MLGLKDQWDLPAKTATLVARALLDLKVNQANQATTEHQEKTDFRAHQALNPARLDQGPVGKPGYNGAPGKDGAVGPVGAPGKDGLNGTPGATGKYLI